MDATPRMPLHRVMAPLNWSRAREPGAASKGVDGDVKSQKDKDGLKTYSLRAQPRAGMIVGVSFFDPSPQLSQLQQAHLYLNAPTFGCKITTPAVPLPSTLLFVNDIDLMLPLDGLDSPYINCGKHWTLYTTIDRLTTEFEAIYAKFMAQFPSSDMPGSAALREGEAAPDATDEPDVDVDSMPGDRCTNIAVMALDELVHNTDDPNTRLFANLFSLHLRATNMGFRDVVKCGPIANMVATALDTWTANDPFLLGPAKEAQDLLAKALDYQPSFGYKPFWVS